jgi:undecaprenyl diphosphate synthase
MTDKVFDFPRRKIKRGSREEQLLEQLNPDAMPRHLAVIMDGNGRWARQRGLPRNMGHREGVKSVREIVESCARLGMDVLTIYAFSVENWKRPKDEVDSLMKMLSEFLRKEATNLVKNGIRFRPVGRWRELPEGTVKEINSAVETTSVGERMLFQVALNYSGRAEIVDACRKLLEECVLCQFNPKKIDEKMISDKLYSPDVCDPDLLIRTSGEFRISNFLLWEIAYTEIYVTDIYWPDFRLKNLLEAIIDYQKRERRFGGLNGGVGE